MAAYLAARATRARFLLLGEAPSHRGCRFSGIAFCSETELVHKAKLVAPRPLALTSAGAPEKLQRERSAAVIWGELERAEAAFDVVLWNAFPWHPYRPAAAPGRGDIGALRAHQQSQAAPDGGGRRPCGACRAPRVL